MQKIGALDEGVILMGAVGFLRDRFNAEISIYSEDEEQRFDPKRRAPMALPYQPAIYVE